jgi:hypothetical protein
MMFNVPQFIDVEDKIAGPMTWKQLLWMICMGGTLLVVFNLFDSALFFITGIPIVLVFVAFAFYRPNGFPLTTFVFYMVMFLFRPKVAVWERPSAARFPDRVPEQPSTPVAPETKQIHREKLEELATILDSRGKHRL